MSGPGRRDEDDDDDDFTDEDAVGEASLSGEFFVGFATPFLSGEATINRQSLEAAARSMPGFAPRGIARPWTRAASRPDSEWRNEGWRLVTLSRGQVLWREGTAADELAWVRRGKLAVVIGGRTVTSIRERRLVGEASVFVEGAKRIGSIVAARTTELMVLTRRQLLELRDAGSETYDALLEAALLTMAERIEKTDTQLVERARGQIPAPRRGIGTALSKLWRRIANRGRDFTPPNAVPSLREMPGLRHASIEILTRLSEVAVPRFVDNEHALFFEGDPGNSLFLVADGGLALLREAGGGSAFELAVMGRGSVIGADALVRGGFRTASAVARADTWVFEIGGEEVQHLADAPRRALYDSLLRALRSQLDAADNLLTRKLDDDEFDDLEDFDDDEEQALEPVLEALGKLQGSSGDK
ncbi:MAG: cyclic nucleotide-binding domain-containing protein [Myxococcales bacterium]|nr:cyclic nucleotide-binding domain-containing protein [Myxococcales bacterium]